MKDERTRGQDSRPRDSVCPRHIPLVIDVQQLLRGHPEVRLMHNGVEYRLRITKQGKLILTK